MSPDGVSLHCGGHFIGDTCFVFDLYSTGNEGFRAQLFTVLFDMCLHLLLTIIILMNVNFLLPFSFSCVVFVFTCEGREEVSQST